MPPSFRLSYHGVCYLTKSPHVRCMMVVCMVPRLGDHGVCSLTISPRVRCTMVVCMGTGCTRAAQPGAARLKLKLKLEADVQQPVSAQRRQRLGQRDGIGGIVHVRHHRIAWRYGACTLPLQWLPVLTQLACTCIFYQTAEAPQRICACIFWRVLRARAVQCETLTLRGVLISFFVLICVRVLTTV